MNNLIKFIIIYSFIFIINIYIGKSKVVDPLEYEALYDIYTIDNGDSWSWGTSRGQKWSFNPSNYSDPCTDLWKGITCTIVVGNVQYFHIISLDLEGFNLRGKFSEKISNLTYLSSLNLASNKIDGSLPVSLSFLKELSFLDLSQNRITGTIPESLYDLRALVTLNLFSNRLNGMLSSKIGNLVRLQTFSIYGNSLEGTIPFSIGQLKNIQILFLYSNFFSGSIPSSIGNLIQVYDLLLYSNRLVSSIPDSICKLKSLQYFEVQNNALTGTIPACIGNLSQLVFLYLKSNQMTGTIPPSLWSLTSLVSLELDQNTFHGTISKNISKLIRLNALYLYENAFSGRFPDSIGELTALIQLQISVNFFTGPLPESIGFLKKLNAFGFYNNDFTGTIPASLFSIGSLKYISGFLNFFTGSLPENITQLNNLVSFQLNNNLISGSIPPLFGSQSSLTQMVLYSNMLTGIVPMPVWSNPSLLSLELYSNFFSGSIPSTIGNTSKMTDLLLAMNLFTGTIPESITQLPLTSIQFYDNYFHGQLPSTLGNMRELRSLKLYQCHLSGTIPLSMQNNRNLQILMLETNQISGNLSDGLCKLFKMREILLYSNQIEGSLPPCMGNLTRLRYLELDNNLLTGVIPSSFSNFSQLLTFTFGNNMLEGTIPRELCTFKKVYEFIVSMNMLSGSLPDCLGDLTALKILYTYNNHLTGPIPESMGRLELLNSIQVYSNHLSGSIPNALMANKSSLINLYLFSNYLTGTLPELYNMTQMTNFIINQNLLNGTIPHSIGYFPMLVVLNLEQNLLTGSIPSTLYQLYRLSYLYLSENYLDGPIKSEISLLFRLVELHLENNRLSSTLPASISHLFFLTSLQLQSNRLQGSVENLFNPLSHPILTRIDLSDNLFTGSVPSTIFLLPSIEIVSLVKNCFHGSLPSTICMATNITILSLDGLSSAANCHVTLYDPLHIFKGYVSQPMQGTIPSCLWDLPNLTTLHLSGNGFSGHLDINGDFFLTKSKIVNVSLSHNKLTGTIPYAIQVYPRFQSLDLSYNRLKGQISDMNNYSFSLASTEATTANTNSSDMQLYVHVNRLSGLIPKDMHDAINVRILSNNLFSCQHFDRHAPIHDPDFDNYICGSSSYDNTLILFSFVILFIVSIVLFMAYQYKHVLVSFYRAYRYTMDYVNGGIESIHEKHPNLYRFHQTLKEIKSISFVTALYALVICLPLYILFYKINGGDYSSRNNQYTWITTSVYLTGNLPAVILLLLWITIMSICIIYGLWVAISLQFKSSSHIEKDVTPLQFFIRTFSGNSSTNFSLSKITGRQQLHMYSKYAFIVLLNTTINLLVNISYVLYLSQRSSTSQLLVQFLLAIYKIVWNMIVVRKLIQLIPKSHISFNLHLSCLIFNSLFAPGLASAFSDSSCFKPYFTGTESISTSYESPTCMLALATNYTIVCFQIQDQVYSTDFNPGFIYSYGCGSQLLSLYIPIFVYSYILLAFFSPLFNTLLMMLSKKNIPEGIYAMIPILLRPQDQAKVSTSKPVSPVTIYNIQISMMMHLVLLFTFGLTAPLLAAIIFIAIFINITMWQIIVVRYIKFHDPLCPMSANFGPRMAQQHNQLQDQRQLPPKDSSQQSHLRHHRSVWIELMKYFCFFHQQQQNHTRNTGSSFVKEIELVTNPVHSNTTLTRPHAPHDKPQKLNKVINAVLETMIQQIETQSRPVFSSSHPITAGNLDIEANNKVSLPPVTPPSWQIHEHPSLTDLPAMARSSLQEESLAELSMDTSCADGWKTFMRSVYFFFVCCMLFYGLILFDMIGDEGGVRGAIWEIILMPILFALGLVAIFFTKKYIRSFSSSASHIESYIEP